MELKMSYTYNKCQQITAYNDNLNVICRMPEHIFLTKFGADAITKLKICATKTKKIVEKRKKHCTNNQLHDSDMSSYKEKSEAIIRDMAHLS